jgi:broad specificity phosphatase PhoE
LRTLLLVRHAHARANADDTINSTPPGEGLTPLGVEEARALGAGLAAQRIDLGVATRLLRAQETLDLALESRGVSRVVVDGLDEIRFGSFEGGPLDRYRDWAWTHPADEPCPGGGESRAEAAARVAGALEALLARPEDVVLAVSHALPIRYVLDAAEGAVPAARTGPVPHATPFVLTRDQVTTARATLRRWNARPRFADD